MSKRDKRRRNREACKQYIKAYKRKHNCIDCDDGNPEFLTFHHRHPNDKLHREDDIAGYIHNRLSLQSLIKKIDKMDLLCAKCHRKRHYEEDYKHRKIRDIINIDLKAVFANLIVSR